MKGKRWIHWFADLAAVGGGAVLAAVAQGALVLGAAPLTAVVVGTAIALKVSRSWVRSKGKDAP